MLAFLTRRGLSRTGCCCKHRKIHRKVRAITPTYLGEEQETSTGTRAPTPSDAVIYQSVGSVSGAALAFKGTAAAGLQSAVGFRRADGVVLPYQSQLKRGGGLKQFHQNYGCWLKLRRDRLIVSYQSDWL
jgi:hypothetical protein